jgi:glycolate dehydrogenase FAD-binding subunit
VTDRQAAARTADALREALGADKVLTGAGAAAYRLAGAEPTAAVLPRAEADVSRALALAFQKGLGVVPWGGGVHQSLGNPPSRYDVALDLRHLNRVLAYEPADMTATVQAGIRLTELQHRVGEAGQLWPLDPPLGDQATVGGIVAANLNGPLRCRYGTVRDLVLGVRVAHADGTITKAGARVVKNATAYDLTKLYAGSYGTLGVLLEATLRLQPRPAVERGWLLAGTAIEECHEAAMRILGSHLAPNRVELLDGAGAEGCGISQGGSALVVSFAGVKEAVQDQGESVRIMAGELGLRVAEIENPAQTWRVLQDFPWSAQGSGSSAFRVLWRGSVLPSDGGKAMHAVRDAVSGYGEVAIAATACHGVLRGVLRASQGDRVASGVAAAREALTALGGFLVVMDVPDPVRGTLDVWGPMPAEVTWMRQIRAAFDAKAILNPGRFIDAI